MQKIIVGTIWMALVLVFPAMAVSQQVMPPEKEPIQPPRYVPPSKSEWLKAGLDPVEYDLAVRYEASLEQWKKMHNSRRSHRMAGWACIGLGLLTPAIEATIIWGGGVDWKAHPQQEAFIMVTVAAGAAIITGIVLLAAAPGPEDIKQAWLKKEGHFTLGTGSSNGRWGLGFSF